MKKAIAVLLLGWPIALMLAAFAVEHGIVATLAVIGGVVAVIGSAAVGAYLIVD